MSKIEKLAQAMWIAACGPQGSDGLFEPDLFDEALSPIVRGQEMARARAALRHLGCVSPAGEVFVPDVKAAVDALASADDALDNVHADDNDGRRELLRGWNALLAALRALTGGSDGG